MSAAHALLRDARVVVCVGSGGVGKTTLAAAFGLGAARLGRRALVLTIDPARRLADALGTGPLGNTPSAIPREVLDALGVPARGGLSAMMLDMKRTFDDLVTRFAPDAATRERILGNRIYQHVSDALAGSAEYSAMEKVYEVVESGGFDCVVLDTPPSQHALDFLEAPQRLIEFLDSRIVKLLVHPAFAAGRFGFRLFQSGARRVLQIVERVSGTAFLEDVSDFLLAFEAMSEGFRARAGRVKALLLDPRTSSFVLVAGPARESLAHAGDLLARLDAAGVPLRGVVVNRVRMWPSEAPPPERIPADGVTWEQACSGLADALAAADPTRAESSRRAARAAIEAAAGYASLVRRDAAACAELSRAVDARGGFVERVPELSRAVSELGELAHIADRWVSSGSETEARA